MADRYTFSTVIEDHEAEVEIGVTFSAEVTFGTPERGRFGPPELYDPGEPGRVEAIRIETLDGADASTWPAEVVARVRKAIEADEEGLGVFLEQAEEREAARADAAAESRAEARREEEGAA